MRVKDKVMLVFAGGRTLFMTILGMLFVSMMLFIGYGTLSWLHSKGILIWL